MAHWLNWKCGIALGVARKKVRVARALTALSKISSAMSLGQISYSKVLPYSALSWPKRELEPYAKELKAKR